MKLKDKVVLVTGGAQGIGKEICITCAREGAKIVVNYVDFGENETIAKATKEELEALGATVMLVQANVASFEETETMFKTIIKEFGRIDVLVNNAGINDIHMVEDITEQEMLSMMHINLLAPIRLIRGTVPNMKKQQYGRIVNIGSIWGVAGKAGRTVYAATKHGIHGVTQTLAVELAPYNILINTICPGYTLTALTRKNNTEEQIQEISSCIPMGRMAEPEEQAKAICFLAGEGNTYITGQQITVDGGYTSL